MSNPPFLNNVASVAAYAPGSAGALLSAGLVAGDSASATFQTATVQIAAGYRPGDELFVGLPSDGSGHFILDAGTASAHTTNIVIDSSGLGRLVLAGVDSTADYQRVLAAVFYRSTAADPSDGGADAHRSITWQVSDGAPVIGGLLQTPPATFGIGVGPFEVAAADLDGDGSLELVTANLNNVSVLTPGTFGVHADFPAGADPNDLAIGDVNGDGKLDLAVADLSGGVSVLQQNGFDSFPAPTNFDTGSSVFAVRFADINHDGRPDLVVTNFVSGSVSVLLNTTATGATSPSFALAQAFATQVGPEGIAVGDLNGDGRPDLAVANRASDSISILLNTTADGAAVPTFLPAQNFATGNGPLFIADADLNGDGKLDLVVSNNGGGGVFVLINTTAIDASVVSFAPLQQFAIGPKAVAVATGDINGDGKPDIVFSTPSDGKVHVLINSTVSGSTLASFAVSQGFTSGVAPGGIALVDYNGDGALDVAVANFADNNVSILLNNSTNVSAVATTLLSFGVPPTLDLDSGSAGTGFTTSFTEHGAPLAIVGADAITDPDSAVLSAATITLTNAKAGDSLSVAGALPGGIGSSIDTSVAGEITVHLTNAASLLDYQTALAHLRFGNASDNPDPTDRDIIVVTTDGTFNSNAAHASVHVADVVHARPPVDDFNGNGDSDILWQNADGTPAVWLTDGTSLVSGANVGFNPGANWHEIGSGDFNGDGKADILWQNIDGTIAEWFMNGTSLISGGSVAFNPGPSWHAVGSGDFNGDGKSDILWQNADGTPAVWLMDGLNILSGANVGFNPGPAWHVIGAGDFNGDGKADILWQNADGTPAVWLMNGTNLISGSNVGFNPGPAWHVIGAGDFNGDGKADILWQNKDGTPAVWLMNGSNLLSGSNVGFNPGSDWHVIGTGDYNSDGKADILWQNKDGTPAVWLMNGTSLVSGANVGFNPGTNWHVIPQHHDLFV
jgi:hypothetical protein